jgi:hypothetical protein
MAGRLGSRWEVAPRHCATRRGDYDNAPRRDSPSRIVSSDHGNGGRLCRSLRRQGSGILSSTVWLAGSRSPWRKRLRQTRGPTRCHIERFPICAAHTVTTSAATHRCRCRAEWSNETVLKVSFAVETSTCLQILPPGSTASFTR